MPIAQRSVNIIAASVILGGGSSALRVAGKSATLVGGNTVTIKSDDVYGRSKAYESIIKKTEIVGPKVPESFNVLVKELQGLGLKVDLVASDQLVDAEAVLATNIHDEATHPSKVEAPTSAISDVDVTEEEAASGGFEFEDSEGHPITEEFSDDGAFVTATNDGDDDMTGTDEGEEV